MSWDLGFGFTPPEQLGTSKLSSHGGIYIITCVYDPVNNPKRHTPLYFGQAGNIEERVTQHHEKYKCWKIFSSSKKLYIRTHQDDNEISRKRKESEMLRNYKPVCNKQQG